MRNHMNLNKEELTKIVLSRELKDHWQVLKVTQEDIFFESRLYILIGISQYSVKKYKDINARSLHSESSKKIFFGENWMIHLPLATTGISDVASVRNEQWEWEMTTKKESLLGTSCKWQEVNIKLLSFKCGIEVINARFDIRKYL